MLRRVYDVDVVCLDMFRGESQEFTPERFRRMVELIVTDTLYWEGVV